MKTPRTIVVEFVGMPGAGKTTISSIVVDELRQQGYICPMLAELDPWLTARGIGRLPPRNRLTRLMLHSKLSYLVAACRHPVLYASALRHALSVRPLNRDSLRASKSPFEFLDLSTTIAGSNRFDFVIFDQGMVQSTCTISICGDICPQQAHVGHVASLIKNMDRYLVILAKITPEIALERIRGRAAICRSQGMSSWMFGHWPEEIQAQKTSQCIQTYDRLGESLKALLPRSVLELDCIADAKENATRVVEFLRHAALRPS
jgi:hypothetical protein